MRSLLPLILFSFSIIFFSSCANDADQKKALDLKEKELELKERELSLKEKEINSHKDNLPTSENQQSIYSTKNDSPVSNTKYVFILIETDEPALEEKQLPIPERSKYDGGLVPDPIPKSYKIVIPKYYSYKSDIFEVLNYTKDKKYIAMDKFEKSVLVNLRETNMNLDIQNNSGMSDPAPSAVAKIIYRTAYVFGTYQSASKKRNGLR